MSELQKKVADDEAKQVLADDELDVVAGGKNLKPLTEERSLEEGDVVTLLSTATYSGGRLIPTSVKQEQWIVKKVVGEDVVVQNVGGTVPSEITVNRRYLRKI